MKKISTVILIPILLLALTACGILGGGGGSTTTTTATSDKDTPITQREPEYFLNPDGESYTLVSIGKPEGTEIVVPSEHDGKPVTGIGKGAFSWCMTLTAITIPEGVTSIGSDAFKDCTGLETVYWNAIECTQTGASWKYIFSTCTSLGTIMLGDGVKSIPTAAFRECKALKTVNLPHSIVSIGNFALFDCTLLTDICYDGTVSEWNALAKGTRWDANIESYTIHCTDGDIEIKIK